MRHLPMCTIESPSRAWKKSMTITSSLITSRSSWRFTVSTRAMPRSRNPTTWNRLLSCCSWRRMWVISDHWMPWPFCITEESKSTRTNPTQKSSFPSPLPKGTKQLEKSYTSTGVLEDLNSYFNYPTKDMATPSTKWRSLLGRTRST